MFLCKKKEIQFIVYYMIIIKYLLIDLSISLFIFPGRVWVFGRHSNLFISLFVCFIIMV